MKKVDILQHDEVYLKKIGILQPNKVYLKKLIFYNRMKFTWKKSTINKQQRDSNLQPLSSKTNT